MRLKTFYTAYSALLVVFMSILGSQVSATAAPEIGTLDTMHLIPPVFAKAGLRSGPTGEDVRDHFLVLSTTVETAFNVSIQNADGSIDEVVEISKAAPLTIELSDNPYGSSDYGALNLVSDGGVNQINQQDGLILTADQLFTANVRHFSGSQGGSLVSKGQTAHGLRFRSGHIYTNSASPTLRAHFISIMATQDNTTVNFADIDSGITFIGETPTSITLNQYESYVVAVNLDLGNNENLPNALNGTLVTSDKNIVMNSGSFLAGYLNDTSGNRDIGIDQILPTSYLGQEFIAVEGDGGTSKATLEVIIVVADEDNTALYVNDDTTAIAHIDAGEHYVIPGTLYVNKVMYVRTSKPAALYQTTSSNNTTGMAMNFLPALIDTLDSQAVLLANVEQLGETMISIVSPASAQVEVNNVLQNAPYSVSGTTDYVVYRQENNTGHVEVSSDRPFTVQLTSREGFRGATGLYIGFPNSYAMNDVYGVQPGVTRVLDVLTNDIIIGRNYELGGLVAQQPSAGTISVNTVDGTIAYTPNAQFIADEFWYQIISSSGSPTDFGVVRLYLDTDGDGLGDFVDPDTDSDGILDTVESGFPLLTGVDTDLDGIDNAVDVDTTGGADTNSNGIDDTLEPRDTDSDGIPDYLDKDSDGDGVPDGLEKTQDSDNDGHPNYLDLDSDNDGISDAIEANNLPVLSGQDQDFDGIDDTLDVNQTGGSDINTNGIDDQFELTDTDEDGTPDFIDVDADDDGVPDALESLQVPELTDTDTDGDGLDDVIDVNQTNGADLNNDGIDDSKAPEDTDGDGVPDYRDIDADNDSILDTTEAQVTGIDTDSDQIDDLFDVNSTLGFDTNQDGIDDSLSLTDFDNDGTPDIHDLDSDNDGLSDVSEADSADANGDGYKDIPTLTVANPPNTDGLAGADYIDLDSNEDGTNDINGTSAQALDTDNNGQIDPGNALDDDNDGVANSLDGTPSQHGIQLDSDGDLINNPLDLDDDNDGLPDTVEQSNGIDIDTDGDGLVDRLDLDSDNDGILDIVEAQGNLTLDTNQDGVLDNLQDQNNDGLADLIDVNMTPDDTDGDGTANFQSLDSDADGLSDFQESGRSPTLSNGSVSAAGQITAPDLDQDGVADVIDISFQAEITPVLDTDSDGLGDYKDLDSDNDGFEDEVENTDFNQDGILDTRQTGGDGLETAVKGAGSIGIGSLIGLLMLSFGLLIHQQAQASKDECGAVDDTHFQRCFFIGGAIGASHLDPEGSVNGFSTDDNSDAGWSLHVGQHFLPHWFWSLKYTLPGEAGLGNANPVLDQLIPDAHVDYTIPSLMAGYYLWQDTHWNIYAKLGVSAINTKVNDDRINQEKQSSIQMALGGGIAYHFDNPWFVQLDVTSYDRDAHFTSLEISRYLHWNKRQPEEIREPIPTPKPKPTPKPEPIVQEIERAPTPEPAPQDTDQDGIQDNLDQCPNTSVGLSVNATGCPVFNGVIQGVNFLSGKAALTPKAKNILNSLVQTLQNQPNIRIRIEAHTDSQGDSQANQTLSNSRAKAVRGYLILQGVSSRRLETLGYGETRPLGDNNTEKGRLQNRRVEFFIVSTEKI